MTKENLISVNLYDYKQNKTNISAISLDLGKP